jgi:site-specific recombinase XerD
MQKILNAVDCVLDFIHEIPLSSGTIDRYKTHYRRDIIPYCETNQLEMFSDDAMNCFMEKQKSRVSDGEISHDYALQLRKAASLLANHMHNRTLVWERKLYNKAKLCEYFDKILEDYTVHLSQYLSPRTVQNCVNYARRFFIFIEKCNVQDLSSLTSEHVGDFIAKTAPTHRGSMSNLTGAIKTILAYLSDLGLININAERYLFNPAPSHKKLLPCFTDDEAEAILNSVDKTTPLGKRDYAVMKTALWTGLRCVDIIGLKRTDIDWNRKVINVFQDKTEVYIQTELPVGVGNAIADYIMDGRPDTNSPYIFVRHNMPYSKLGVTSGNNIIRRYLEKAGVFHKAGDGKTFHAFRRTLGTRLVRAGIPIRSVAEMLGQLNINSAKRYISLDNQGLRICCLDISAFRTRKEGLV